MFGSECHTSSIDDRHGPGWQIVYYFYQISPNFDVFGLLLRIGAPSRILVIYDTVAFLNTVLSECCNPLGESCNSCLPIDTSHEQINEERQATLACLQAFPASEEVQEPLETVVVQIPNHTPRHPQYVLEDYP